MAGSQLVIFDPHCTYLPNITPQNPGKRIDFVQSSAAEAHPDQFAPYQAFGCDAKSYFRGTLFRFPLRTAQQAAKSRISKQVLRSTLLLISINFPYSSEIVALLHGASLTVQSGTI